jgi:predicted enzyme related to lactoylglutathione lyase
MAGFSFFELGVEDAERGRAFYEGLFGWRFAPGPSGNGFQIETPGGPGGNQALPGRPGLAVRAAPAAAELSGTTA